MPRILRPDTGDEGGTVLQKAPHVPGPVPGHRREVPPAGPCRPDRRSRMGDPGPALSRPPANWWQEGLRTGDPSA
ncbi:hypothetical protein NHU_02458 [Rhodovulum sulfidophilum]|uniref:Uncharacterized protein n=1 Tax=Rhodovulum sulfidophilum TaxID=35806 RepID=A0A0D6B4G1_RHOSU|nr:hypothetical protein NHU_02458 [Rhodovulum sulfidophilum]